MNKVRGERIVVGDTGVICQLYVAEAHVGEQWCVLDSVTGACKDRIGQLLSRDASQPRLESPDSNKQNVPVVKYVVFSFVFE